jgi:hypothetical protein
MATRQVPTLPWEHQASVSGKSQTHRRTGTSVFAGVAPTVYRDRHQANGEETGRRSDTENDTGNAGTSKHPVASLNGRHRSQYRLH